MTGTLVAIARRAAHRAPMEVIARGRVTIEAGLEGDYRGAKYPKRQITVLAKEDWEAALADVPGAPNLPWTARRANFLVDGVDLSQAAGAVLRLGAVTLEVTGETNPCHRMEEASPGLLKALSPDWRGGVTCRVLEGGDVAVGDAVEVAFAPAPTPKVKLPG